MVLRLTCPGAVLWLAGCHALVGYHSGPQDGGLPDTGAVTDGGGLDAREPTGDRAPADGPGDLRGDTLRDGLPADGPQADGSADVAVADLAPADLTPADLTPADLTPADLTPADVFTADAPTGDGGCAESPRVVITEMMIDPKSADPDAEWVELFNPGDTTIDLSDWYLVDGDAVRFTIPPGALEIPARQYVVLCADAVDPVVGCDLIYSQGQPCTVYICLANTGDRLALYDEQSALVDSVTYTTGWPFASGASMSLIDPCADNDRSVNWCEETVIYGGPGNNRGTPGQPAGCP